jgi:hypothetical protein
LAAGSGGFAAERGACAPRGRSLGPVAPGQDPAEINDVAATAGHPAALRWLLAWPRKPSSMNGRLWPRKKWLGFEGVAVCPGDCQAPRAIAKLPGRLPSSPSSCPRLDRWARSFAPSSRRLYGRNVTSQGWAEFLAWMQERSAAGPIDREVAWEQFRALAVPSEHAGLGELIVRFSTARSEDRLALAGTIAAILAPVAWPVAWEDARTRLVGALDGLVREATDSKLHALELGQDQDVHTSGWFALSTARDLLRIPCRRDELGIVAKLCAMGNFWCWRAIGRALLRLGERATDAPAMAARRGYAIAFATYAESARAMNEACGGVLFTGLDLTFEDHEAT